MEVGIIMNTMSDDIVSYKQHQNYSSMSGDIRIYECMGNVNSMSGDIELNNCKSAQVKTMSGNIFITDSTVGDVSSVSGDIMITKSNAKSIFTVTGEIMLKDSTINKVECSTKFALWKTNIETLILHGGYTVKSTFEWWNPFSWFSSQISGNNSVNIQCNEGLFNSSNVKINGRTLEELDEDAEPIKFTIPDDCKIDKIILKTEGIVYSKEPVEVIGGELVLI